MTIRERQKECNTLVSLLSGTVGHQVTVDLRNETTVSGIYMYIRASELSFLILVFRLSFQVE